MSPTGVVWTSAEWALAVLIFDRYGRAADFRTLRRQERDLLQAATGRSGSSWKARIDNIVAVVEGGSWTGGAGGEERVRDWLNRLESNPSMVREAAPQALLANDAGRQVARLLDLDDASLGRPDEAGTTRGDFDGFSEFCRAVETEDRLAGCAVSADRTFTFWNTSGEGFQIGEADLIKGLRRWAETNDQIAEAIVGHRNSDGFPDYTADLWTYTQNPFRDVFKDLFTPEEHPVFRALGRSQTYAFVAFMRKYVGYLIDDKDCAAGSSRLLDRASIVQALSRRESMGAYLRRLDEDTATGKEEPSVVVPVAIPDFKWLVDQTFLPEGLLREMVDSIMSRGQIILSGVPGNGKTHLARCLARALTDDCAGGDYGPKAWSLVQFHPSYGYEQFVEGVMPGVDGKGHVVFAAEDGVVLRLADAVRAAGPGGIHVLVVDELNRANLPRVLGELLYLLEYRDETITLRFREGFSLPDGLLFIGTMITADRSIRSIDTALRRRFYIFELEPSSDIIASWYSSGRGSTSIAPGLLKTAFDRMNERLIEQADSHHRIGHTFFMVEQLDATRLKKIWTRQVFPLIKEALFGVAESDLVREYEALFAPLWTASTRHVLDGQPDDGAVG